MVGTWTAARVTLIATAVMMAGTATAAAQEFFAAARPFVIETACDATRAIKGGEPTALEVGRSYDARGFNRKNDATHVLLKTADRTSKWVAIGCGRFTDAIAAGPGVSGGAPVAATQPAATPPAKPAPGAPAVATTASAQPPIPPGPRCQPFFDDLRNPTPAPLKFGGRADITPPAPALNEFDKAAAKVCGPAGKVVAADEFKQLLRDNSAVLDRIMEFTGGRVFANRPARGNREDYLGELTEAWFALKAYDHIFCGEPNPSGGQIGGLHFHGRYLQLQQTGEACRMPNYDQNEVVPGLIYTMGVMMRNASGGITRDARKGYGLTLSAEDILKVVTRAFTENATTSSESMGCILPVADDGRKFKTVFVRRAAGIRTFYPDATPNGRGERKNPDCAGEIRLP
jgi:hypothetical protein